MNGYLADLLRIPRDRLILFAGAGITISASGGSPIASWPGLLEDGLRYCLDRNLMTADAADLQRRLLAPKQAAGLESVGHEITRLLGGNEGRLFEAWMQRAFDGLAIKSPAILDALRAIGLKVFTTNYDDVIERHTGWDARRWDDPRHLRTETWPRNFVFHLHGWWRDPASVILGTASYQRILDNQAAQAVLRALFTTYTVIFTGFGSGFDDDNFSALQEWIVKALGTASNTHYVLLLDAEADAQNAQLPDQFRAIGYGNDHSLLPEFLQQHWPAAAPAAAPAPAVSGDNRVTPASSQQVPPGAADALAAAALQGLLAKLTPARAVLDQLVDATVKRKRPDRFLFASTTDDGNPSITVSAIGMMALHEVQHRITQFICDDLLAARIALGENAGAWPGQGINDCHNLGVAWALFACLRVRPACVKEMAPTVEWLLRRRAAGSGGWGFKTGRPRAFYTAYALNALSEYVSCAQVIGAPVAPVETAIREGIAFLTKDAKRLGNPERIPLLWSQDPAGTDLCIASTAMAIHVLTKCLDYAPGDRDLYAGPLKKAVRLLLRIMEDGPAAYGTHEATIEEDGQIIVYDPWPKFEENDPNYWYKYFTPVISVTLLETSRDLGISNLPATLGAITRTVDWLQHQTRSQADGLPGVFLREQDRTVAIWPTVQAIIILSRWLNSLSVALSEPDIIGGLQAAKPR